MQSTICVCGAGTMGSGIAQTAAASGLNVILFDLDDSILERAKQDMEAGLKKRIEKGKISSEEAEQVMSRIQLTNNLYNCLADFIIEAIIEKTEAKIALLNQLAEINHSDTVFATNTSSLSVTAIAESVNNPARVIGMHFFNPATILKLVEVVQTKFTNEQTLQLTTGLAKRMGKIPVVCSDAPGFIVNRVARPFYIESLRIAEENIADIPAIDRIIESAGFRMGPFKLMDLIGNDVNYKVSCSVYEQLGQPERLKPSSIQKEKVDAGNLGRKSGKGYYEYN